MLVLFWAVLLLVPPGLLTHAGWAQVSADLETAELQANERFSESVPPGTSLSDARSKGYAALRDADITYDRESEEFFRSSIAWFRWVAYRGDHSAAEELAHRYRELARHYSERNETWWPHFKLDERLGLAYRELSCAGAGTR
tara:strand:+ start:856 stop:1281 length:426 start_codon:yes stop_codon:yes gene_type:complete